MEKIKVILVDDQVLFIESLKTVLEAIADDIQIIGTAYNGKEAINLIKRNVPDIALLDVRMPVMDGVETASYIVQHFPDVKVMMLTTFDDDQYAHQALERGAMGYMLKDMPPRDLVKSIRALAAGSIQISPQIFHKLLYSENSGSEYANDEEIKLMLDKLSKREKDILQVLSEGLDNQEIAERKFIAEQTVKNHIHNIYSKLNIHDRTALVRFSGKISPYL